MSRSSKRLEAKHKEGDGDDDADLERTATVELRNPVTAVLLKRQPAQEQPPGAAAAAEPATVCTHGPMSPTAVLKFEGVGELYCDIDLGPVDALKALLGTPTAATRRPLRRAGAA